jgi:DNA polymerase-3 subunit epsilon
VAEINSMPLKLHRPIAFFDLETTGISVGSDRIVEISILKIFPNGIKESKTMRINPEMPIPAGSSAIHGIYDADVKDCPTFKEVAGNIMNFLDNCDFAGYNSNTFDIPLLTEEFMRVGFDFDPKTRRFVDVQNIFHKKEQRTLAAAYKFYCEKELTNAHSAEADIMATWEVLEAQLNKYPDLQQDVAWLAEYSQKHKSADLMGRIIYNEKGEEIFNFGKHKGKTVESVLKAEPSYYEWMMQGDFPQYTKRVLTSIRLRGIGK